jgi:hypothetical protein
VRGSLGRLLQRLESGGQIVQLRGEVGVTGAVERGSYRLQAQTVLFQLLDRGDGVDGGRVVEAEPAAGAFGGLQQPELGVVIDGRCGC